jgi:hypothetical protein
MTYCGELNPDTEVGCDLPLADHPGWHAHHDLDGLPETPDEEVRTIWVVPAPAPLVAVPVAA